MRPPEPQPQSGARAALEIVPLGDFAPALGAALAARLSRHVGVPCRLVAAAPIEDGARLAGREQLDAQALLRLVAGPASSAVVRLGLTTLDVGLPVFNFVFGLAHTDGVGAAVVSLARLDPVFEGLPADDETTARRALAEMLHELGHVAGLLHCGAPDCLMRFAGTVAQADARGAAFCSPCRARLPPWLRGPAWP